MNVNDQWIGLLRVLMNGANTVSPRGMLTREILGFQSCVDMHDPRLLIPERKLSARFQHAEAAWILSGDNRVSTIAPYNKNISPFADDGQRYFGAYGPKVIDQLPYVAAKLRQDLDTRQAVINIWRENPPQTKDVPCTLSLQFVARHSQLWTLATMRSSDAWLGWPYDVFNFSMVARAVIIYLRELGGPTLRLGNLLLTAGSQHVYEKHFQPVTEIINREQWKYEQSHYACPSDYRDVDEFVKWLWHAADSR